MLERQPDSKAIRSNHGIAEGSAQRQSSESNGIACCAPTVRRRSAVFCLCGPSAARPPGYSAEVSRSSPESLTQRQKARSLGGTRISQTLRRPSVSRSTSSESPNQEACGTRYGAFRLPLRRRSGLGRGRPRPIPHWESSASAIRRDRPRPHRR